MGGSVQNRRLVITGLGPVTPVAVGIKKFAQEVFSGTIGKAIIKNDGTKNDANPNGKLFKIGVVDNDELKKELDRINKLHADLSKRSPISDDPRSSELALVAADLALRDAGLVKEDQIQLVQDLDPYSIEVHTAAGSETGLIEAIVERLRAKGNARPTDLVRAAPNLISNRLSLAFGIKGLHQVVHTACAGAIACIDNAIRSLREPITDSKLALVGSVEADAVEPVELNLFAKAGIVKSVDPKSPEQRYSPFDKTTQGVRLSEGAGYLVLEDLAHAKARDAKIYAEVVSSAQCSDAVSQLAPNGIGLERAVRLALKKADLEPSAIKFIQVHGSGNEQSDKSEANAIRNVFGTHIKNLKITANKSRHGHTLHNSAFVNIAELALSLKEGKPSPNIAITEPLIEDLPMTSTQAEVCDNAEYGMAFGLGVGGTNAVVILKKYHED